MFTDVTISSTAPAADVISTDGKVQFLGTYSPAAIDNGNKACLFLGAANTLYWPDVDNYQVGAFRAYFQVDLGYGLGVHPQKITNTGDGSGPVYGFVRSFVLNFSDSSEETTTGSVSMEEGIVSREEGRGKKEDVAGAWFSLDGVRLDAQPTRKGLYIHGGKKIVIP